MSNFMAQNEQRMVGYSGNRWAGLEEKPKGTENVPVSPESGTDNGSEESFP